MLSLGLIWAINIIKENHVIGKWGFYLRFLFHLLHYLNFLYFCQLKLYTNFYSFAFPILLLGRKPSNSTMLRGSTRIVLS